MYRGIGHCTQREDTCTRVRRKQPSIHSSATCSRLYRAKLIPRQFQAWQCCCICLIDTYVLHLTVDGTRYPDIHTALADWATSHVGIADRHYYPLIRIDRYRLYFALLNAFS